jgi:hypothetical protein
MVNNNFSARGLRRGAARCARFSGFVRSSLGEGGVYSYGLIPIEEALLMKRLLYTILAIALLAPTGSLARGQAADSEAAAKVIVENEFVRVTQADFFPGTKSSYTVPDGRQAVVIRLRLPKPPKPGEKPDNSLQLDRVLFLDDGEEMSHGEPPNGNAFREVRIELKKDPPRPAFEKDAVKLDPSHNILLEENEHFRVVQVHFGLNEQGPLVDKRPRVIIILTDTHAQVVKPGGAPEVRDGAAGTVQWSLGGSQATINLDTLRLNNTVVELKGK